MGKTKSEAERVALLNTLGISAKGKTLGGGKPQRSTPTESTSEVTLALKGMDPHTMAVEDIVFDPRLLEEYTDLAFNAEGSVASRKIFDLYKSIGKNKDRNGALQRRITSFITAERRSRLAGHPISEKIKTTSEQRDMAALAADSGYSPEEMAEAFRLLEESKKEA